MNHEVPIRQDPNLYTPRNIFGVFDLRTFTVAVAIVAVVTPIVICTFMFNIPSTITAILLGLVVLPIAIFGLAKKHGMYAEKWLPLARKAKNLPHELKWEPASVSVITIEEKPTRAEKKALKAARKARAQENELEGNAFSDALERLKGTN